MDLHGLQSYTVDDFDALLRSALHDMRLAKIGYDDRLPCKPCRAAVFECNSRATHGARSSRQVDRRSGRCRDDWHRACGLEKKKMQKRAGQVAVTNAPMFCMMVMPSDGCTMALRPVGSVHMLISSQSSSLYAAARALAGGGMTPKRSACQIVSTRSRGVVNVGGSRLHLSFARKQLRCRRRSAIVALGELVMGRVEAERFAVVVGADHKIFVDLVELEPKPREALFFEL
eukprot:5102238-Pleurochrysis_carterae.AAC.1